MRLIEEGGFRMVEVDDGKNQIADFSDYSSSAFWRAIQHLKYPHISECRLTFCIQTALFVVSVQAIACVLAVGSGRGLAAS